MGLLTRFLGTVFAVLLAAYFIQGFHVDGFYTAVIVALILGLLNVTLKPIITLLTLPLNLLTLGLFSFVINAGLIMLVSTFVKGFTVDGFLPALWAGALIAVVGWILHKLSKK
ncbi:MAG: phage holin family protein [Candidatus Paceibacterota bacterium]